MSTESSAVRDYEREALEARSRATAADAATGLEPEPLSVRMAMPSGGIIAHLRDERAAWEDRVMAAIRADQEAERAYRAGRVATRVP